MEQNKHWQSFGERNNSKEFLKASKKEFQEELPFEVADTGFLNAKAPRRDFLKYLGFSTAAAAVAASCEMPVRHAVPFANKPTVGVPGLADYYATTFVQDGDVVSVVAKVRDGRPIKIEGNELSPITRGGTSARVQASVLELYDTARLRFPVSQGKEVTLNTIDRSIVADLAKVKGSVVVLTSSQVSPSSQEVIRQFLAKHSAGAKHVVYDAVSYTSILLANDICYGKKIIPSYRFDKAKIIVSLDADFLGTWLSPIEFSKQYATGKKLNEKNPIMSRHLHFESVASLTGSNADDKFLHAPSQTGAVALAILNALNGQNPTGFAPALLKGIIKTAKLLAENKGKALVVSGSDNVNVQIVVNAINEIIKANDATIDWQNVYTNRQGIDGDFVKLLEDMNAGRVGALFVFGANPAYTWHDNKRVVNAFAKVPLTVSFCGKEDETAQLCKYIVPDHHYLESWGDAEIKNGQYSLLQPAIAPLFKTRQWQDSLLKWSGSVSDYATFLKNYWVPKLGSVVAWETTLQEGVFQLNVPAAKRNAFNLSAIVNAKALIVNAKHEKGIELRLYQKVTIGAGQGAANPWLQETPDPVTRATWDNYVVISPALAKKILDIDLTNAQQTDAYEVHPAKKMVTLTVQGISITLPALIIPGTNENTIGVALGFGRTPKLGKTATSEDGKQGRGANVFPFTTFDGYTVRYAVSNTTVTLAEGTYPVALTQTHNVYDTPQGKRTEVMKELTLSELQANPKIIIEEREEELAPYGGIENFRAKGTIYPDIYKYTGGIKWGMNVDLNTCTGCAACVVACTAENNVPVVGKPEVLRAHEMHWLRIDRYYSGDLENPKVVFQPLMCQHCDNAPCENVCPVAATNHSAEGLNQMTYNRCIGTRYCANNCPYKVRRFNWADYMGADSFPDNQRDNLNDVVMDMNDDLTRMVLNPDVTVRSRGVIEKCSFCVQRLQEGKLKAKQEGRPLKTGANNEWDLKTACQQSCPTDAITFGNVNDHHSAISIVRKENPNRTFLSLEQIHVLPNVTYLAKVRNVEEEA